MLKRYIVFLWLSHDLAAGWDEVLSDPTDDNLLLSFDTVEAAKTAAVEAAKSVSLPCWQIVDLQAGMVEDEFFSDI